MTDYFMTHEGDLLINIAGDEFAFESGIGEALQDIAIIVKTSPGEFQYNQLLGCALYSLVGKLLTKDVLSEGERLIHSALNSSEKLSEYTITVRGVPVSTNEALFIIAIEDNDENETLYIVPFDFEHGVIEQRTSIEALKRRGLIDTATEIIGILPR